MPKNVLIIVGRDGRPSMKGVYSKMESNSNLFVRRRLEQPNGKVNEYWRVYKDHNVNHFNKQQGELHTGANVVIRWGNSIALPKNEGKIMYNCASAITKASNKKLSREIFEQNGLSCPKIIRTSNDITKYPIIARPSKHSKGKNFVVINDINEYNRHSKANPDWYYSEYIDKVAEYRLHCAHGRVLNYLEKPAPRDKNQLAWNRAQNEDPFVNVKWDAYNKNVAHLCLQAVKTLGLDFSGVDCMIDKDGKAYLLEVNTAATLASSEYSMSRYAKYFDWLGKSDKKREHFELKEFKKASNYAWHEFHFEDREPNKEIQ